MKTHEQLYWDTYNALIGGLAAGAAKASKEAFDCLPSACHELTTKIHGPLNPLGFHQADVAILVHHLRQTLVEAIPNSDKAAVDGCVPRDVLNRLFSAAGLERVGGSE